ncbi:MAG: symmetrical bis(5'-nucleosyl)-tetraphosphatase [Thalassotalea sp.]
MALYLVGDIQGCYSELKALLKKVNFNPQTDQLWALGDIVARGPDSLKTVLFLKSLGKAFNMVLGNHDLHLLAIYHGIKKAKKSDKLESLLAAKELPEIIEWLVQMPLLLQTPDKQGYLSHAGISPQWTIKEAIANAKFAEKKLRSAKLSKWLTIMYGEQPNDWLEIKSKEEKFRYVINAFTRMRFCYLDGSLEFKCKQDVNDAPEHLKPWFELTQALTKKKWVFGHWASLLGKCNHNNVYATDTGCVWGNNLTLLRWEDKKYFIEPAH